MIGERLAEIRKDRGVTQKELAKLLSVSPTTVSGYENDFITPTDDTKVRIAKHFDVSLDYLLGAHDEEVALDRAYTVNLPKEFPLKVREDVVDYVNFLVVKHEVSNEKNNPDNPGK